MTFVMPPLSEQWEAEWSRSGARRFRSDILQNRAKGCCEACGLYAPYILEAHHVKPVKEGGKGWPENLIMLCANCHRYVTTWRHIGIRDMRICSVEECIDLIYSEDSARLIKAIASERVALGVDGKWHVL